MHKAFALSKMTVVQDATPEGAVKYNRLSKVEFMEFLSRIADLVFKETEMEEV